MSTCHGGKGGCYNLGMKTRIIIPARLASTRLPEKLLRRVGGQTVLRWTHDAAVRCGLGPPIVAVDDDRLAEEVDRFGGRSVRTSVDCASGTDRIAEAVASLRSAGETIADEDVIVNLQGDEPEIDPGAVRRVAGLLIDHPAADMATAATPIRDAARLSDPNVVKLAMEFDGHAAAGGQAVCRAVYFSRSVVPHDRDGVVDLSADDQAFGGTVYWHHLGLYAYRVAFLRWFARSRPSLIERVEKLEQLRALSAGKTILVAAVDHATAGIDTADDLSAFEQRCKRRQMGS